MPSHPIFSGIEFHPVIKLPADYEVYDFTQGYHPDRPRKSPYGIGKYNERRPGMYVEELFQDQRDVHIGIDIAAPIGTSVHVFFAGSIAFKGINSAPGDYGGTIITEHRIGDQTLWALHGHLSHASVDQATLGQTIAAGDVIGGLGSEKENGGWNPHLHFQLSNEKPVRCDMPGVVSLNDLPRALKIYPDPQIVLGKLY